MDIQGHQRMQAEIIGYNLHFPPIKSIISADL